MKWNHATNKSFIHSSPPLLVRCREFTHPTNHVLATHTLTLTPSSHPPTQAGQTTSTQEMALLVCLAVPQGVSRLGATPPPPRPAFPDSFSCDTAEVDDTLNGTITVTQTLHRDSATHRSWMSANGSLVAGGEEQIERCDIKPMGWLIIAGGADARNLSSWSCTNQSIDSDPSHCQWNPFWASLPQNATFAGQEIVDGRQSHRWNYWMGGEQWAMWASLDGKSPVATGKTWTWHPTYHLWRILWRGFEAGPPPLSDFDLTDGIKCGPAPPPAPPPAPFKPATDCKPSCGSGALCCQDPAASPPGTCFAVQNCSQLPGPADGGPVGIPRTLHELHMAASRRARGGV
jgi:hypothetical protein